MPYADKEKQRTYQREWARQRGGNAQRMRTKKDRGMAFAHRVKLMFGCIDCGYNDHPKALTFDHVRGTKKRTKKGKTIDIAEMYMYKISSLKEEMRKCEGRCANCHNIATAERR